MPRLLLSRVASASANSPLKVRDVDGKAWIVSARTSIGTRALIAITHSWIAAHDSGRSSVPVSYTHLTLPTKA